jgi:hypothetical protein
VELLGVGPDQVAIGQLRAQALRDPALAVEGAGKLAVDAAVVSASSPRFAASKQPSSKVSLRWNAHNAASSERTT